MTPYQKVVWFEGMTLEPQHFQQLDRYHQAALNFRIRTISHYNWGLISITIDKERLANGQFYLLGCAGVTPDGLAFNIPDNDPVPITRNIQESFPATEDKLAVFLAVPVERVGEMNCLLEGSPVSETTRFRSENITIADDNTGANRRPIDIARANFQIRFGNESMENFSTIQIAELIRKQDGGFGLSGKFIAPSLSTNVSEVLRAIVNMLLERLVSNRASLWERHKQKVSGPGEFSTTDLTVFWLLHTINAFIPLINHYYTIGYNHPEELFSLMLTLAGQLTTFVTDDEIHPRDFPRYEHSNLSNCFNQLNDIIHNLLKKLTISGDYESIPLEKREDTLYIGRVDDPTLLSMPLFFSFSGDIPEQKITEELPRMIRIAAEEDIHNLERYALPGLNITYTPRPPAGLPSQPELHYFRLEKVGPLWDAICKNQSLAIRIPIGYERLELKLLAAKQSK